MPVPATRFALGRSFRSSVPLISSSGISYFSVTCPKYSVPSSIRASRGVKSMAMNHRLNPGRQTMSSSAHRPITTFPAGRARFMLMPMPVRSFIIARLSFGL